MKNSILIPKQTQFTQGMGDVIFIVHNLKNYDLFLKVKRGDMI